ncbi:hypothetical protein Pelo_722 [Pelomyxa schiedti]|nr:hypothetical protein Pelo_722 [Pelomyxa schiedti]
MQQQTTKQPAKKPSVNITKKNVPASNATPATSTPAVAPAQTAATQPAPVAKSAAAPASTAAAHKEPDFELENEDVFGNLYVQLVSKEIRSVRGSLGRIVGLEEKMRKEGKALSALSTEERTLVASKDSLEMTASTLERVRDQVLKAYHKENDQKKHHEVFLLKLLLVESLSRNLTTLPGTLKESDVEALRHFVAGLLSKNAIPRTAEEKLAESQKALTQMCTTKNDRIAHTVNVLFQSKELLGKVETPASQVAAPAVAAPKPHVEEKPAPAPEVKQPTLPPTQTPTQIQAPAPTPVVTTPATPAPAPVVPATPITPVVAPPTVPVVATPVQTPAQVPTPVTTTTAPATKEKLSAAELVARSRPAPVARTIKKNEKPKAPTDRNGKPIRKDATGTPGSPNVALHAKVVADLSAATAPPPGTAAADAVAAAIAIANYNKKLEDKLQKATPAALGLNNQNRRGGFPQGATMVNPNRGMPRMAYPPRAAAFPVQQPQPRGGL